ncbi:MAG: anti-sigma factor domain-containing protein [Clostridia bacterium]
MHRRAIIVKVRRRYAVVLVDGFRFRRVPVQGQPLEVGQELWIPTRSRRTGFAWVWAGVAAVTAIVAFIVYRAVPRSPTLLPPAAAWVSVDINPSLDIAISPRGRVVAVRGLDRAGDAIAAEIPYGRHDSLQAVITMVARAAEREHFLAAPVHSHAYVVLAAAPTELLHRTVALRAIRVAAAVLAPFVWQPRVSLITLPLASPGSVRRAAVFRISLGRYLLAELTDRSPNALRTESLARILAHWPMITVPPSSPSSLSSTAGPPPSSSTTARSTTSDTTPPSTTSPTTPVTSAAPTTSSSNSGAAPSSAGPGPTTITVTGLLNTVGPDAITVGGATYPLSLNTTLTLNGLTSSLSLAQLLLLQGDPVTITLTDGVVVNVSVTV